MKKFCILILISVRVIGQSITLTPNSNPSGTIKTNTNSAGFEHTDGTIRLQTYLNNSSAQYLGGWIQTYTAHPLIFSTTNGLPQMFLNNNGNIILNPNDGKTGNVGIGISKTSTPAEKLEVNGNIRVLSLAGIGVRNVYSDANGTLTNATITKYFSAPYFSFVKISNDGNEALYYGGVAYLSSGTTPLYCPMYLPDGVKVLNARFYYKDNDITNDLSFAFNTSSNATGFPTGTTPVSSTGNNAGIQFLDINLSSNTIDNQNNTYYAAVYPKTGGSIWTNSINFGVISIVITYTE